MCREPGDGARGQPRQTRSASTSCARDLASSSAEQWRHRPHVSPRVDTTRVAARRRRQPSGHKGPTRTCRCRASSVAPTLVPRSLRSRRETGVPIVARRLGTGLRERASRVGLYPARRSPSGSASRSPRSTASSWARRERGLDTWAAFGAALGLQLASFFEQAPGADQPRDIEHLRRQNLVIPTARPAAGRRSRRRCSRRWPLPAHDRRPPGASSPARGGRRRGLGPHARRRRSDARPRRRRSQPPAQRLGPEWRVQGLLVVRGTHRNRALVRELDPCSRQRFPASSQAWLAALAEQEDRHAGARMASLWTSVRAGPDDPAPGRRLCAPRLTRRPCNTRARAGRGRRRLVRPRLTLGLLAAQHALIHGQSALYPLVYLAVIDEFGVTAATIVILSTIGGLASGLLQYAFGALIRWFGRPLMLGLGRPADGRRHGAPGVAPPRSRRSPSQHRLEDRRRATAPRRQRAPRRAVAGHPPRHGDRGPCRGRQRRHGPDRVRGGALDRRARLARRRPRARHRRRSSSRSAILSLVREPRRRRGSTPPRPRSAPSTAASSRTATCAGCSRAAVLGGGSRGLGVLNIFVPLYLDQVLHLDPATIGVMYGVLLAACVPGPLVSGWLSDRVGRKPVIVGVYLGGAVSLALFVLAGSNTAWLWIGIVALSLFSFVESPQLQALIADVTPPRAPRRRVQHLLRARVRRRVVLGDPVRRAHRRRGQGPGRGLAIVFWVMAGGVDPGRGWRRCRSGSRRPATYGTASPRRLERTGRGACAIIPRPSAGTFGRGVAQLGSAHRSGR